MLLLKIMFYCKIVMFQEIPLRKCIVPLYTQISKQEAKDSFKHWAKLAVLRAGRTPALSNTFRSFSSAALLPCLTYGLQQRYKFKINVRLSSWLDLPSTPVRCYEGRIMISWKCRNVLFFSWMSSKEKVWHS